MKTIRIMVITLFSVILLNSTNVVLAQEPQVVGETAILIDANTGQILYSKNPHQQMYPASTTKMLTALVAIERGNLDEMVSVSASASNAEGSAIWVLEGERISLEHMLYALMLNSANDVAEAIAEHLAGSVEQFNHMLNDTAVRVGAKNTNFTNPHGLPDENHYTTAYDLAMMAREAMKNTTFAEIAGTKTKTIDREDPDALKFLINHNRLLWRYGHATGVKTGYTRVAQQCIVASAQRDERQLIAVVLKSQGTNIWTDATALLEYGFNNFEPILLVENGEVVGETPVKYSKEVTKLLAAEEKYYLFPVNYEPEIKRELKIDGEPTAPVQQGEIMGELAFFDGSQKITNVAMVSQHPVERPLNTYWWYWLAVASGIIASLVIITLLIMKYNKLKIRRRRN